MNKQPGKSLDEIAAMMAANTIAMRGGAPVVKDTVDEDIDDDTTDTSEIEAVDGAAAVELTAGGPVDDAVSSAVSDDNDADGPETIDGDDATALDDPFEIEDDDLLDLGNDTQVTIGDLKKAYSADTGMVEQFEAAKTANQEAINERARAVVDSQKTRAAAQAMFEHMSNIVSQPLIGEPPAGLKTTDPARYIEHLEAYNGDQKRIVDAKALLLQAVETHTTQEDELLANRKQHELRTLVSKLPALAAEDTKQQASQDILDAGDHYGFSPDEINNAVDHRVYQMAYDAQQYRKLMAKSAPGVESLKETARTAVKQQTRTLRSKGTGAKNRLTAQAKQQRVLKTRAVKSGKVDDVAAILAAKARR